MKADKLDLNKKELLRLETYLDFAYQFAIGNKMPMEQDDIKRISSKVKNYLKNIK